MACKGSGHSGVGIVLNVKEVTLECINYAVPGLSSLFCIMYIAINEIIVLGIGLPDCFVFNIIIQVYQCHSLGDSSAVLTCLWSVALVWESGDWSHYLGLSPVYP